MINKIHFSITFIVITSFIYGQQDSILSLFPMYNGDIHQFHYHYSYYNCQTSPPTLQTHSSYHIEEILGDTILNGFNYKIIESDLPSEPYQYYLRIDTTTLNVYKYVENPLPNEVLMDSLRANLGDQFIREGWMPTECVEIDTPAIFEVPTIVKHFYSYFVPGSEYSLAYGFGRINYLTFMDDGCYPITQYHNRDLVYAKINEKIYGTCLGTNDQQWMQPNHIELYQNYPNPFNPSTTIRYSIPERSLIKIYIYNTLGEEIKRLVIEEKFAGSYEVNFDGSDLSSGIYFYRLESNKYSYTRKMILLK